MNRIILIVLSILFYSNVLSFDRAKVLFALFGGTAAEPKYVEIFIAGYESSGGHWTGQSDTATVTDGSDIVDILLPEALSNGFNLVANNFNFAPGINPYGYPSWERIADTYYNLGIQCVVPAGSNQYHYHIHSEYITNVITCSAGDTAAMTGYYSEFFSSHPYNDYTLTAITQGSGDTATVEWSYIPNGGAWLIVNTPVIFRNVVGFQNTISGLKFVVKFVEDGAYNKFKIIHNLGTGSFVSGNAKIFFESYATPYLAGMLAFVRDSLKCSWWEARYRMRMTATGSGTLSQYGGYGKPTVAAAVAFSGPIPADPYDALGTICNITAIRNKNSVTVTFDTVGNALTYEVYNNSTLVGSYTNHGTVDVSIGRTKRNHPHQFWYRALRGDQMTAESNKVEIPYYYYRKIQTR